MVLGVPEIAPLMQTGGAKQESDNKVESHLQSHRVGCFQMSPVTKCKQALVRTKLTSPVRLVAVLHTQQIGCTLTCTRTLFPPPRPLLYKCQKALIVRL